MIEIEREGGWYCDAKVRGRKYSILMLDQHIETDYGNVPLSPGKDSLFLRINNQVSLAGSGQDGKVWEWIGVAWYDRGSFHGNHPVIYDNHDVLHINHDTNLATGFRFVDENDKIWTCDETYVDKKRHIYEWTVRGNVTIGQGEESGILALYDNRRFRLADGFCRMINVDRVGDDFAISWWSHLGGSSTATTAHIKWMSLAEILACKEEFLPVPAIDFCLDKYKASAPAVVTGTIIQKEYIKDWRWLKDELIDKPDAGDTHEFHFDVPGKYTTSIRAQSMDDDIVFAPIERVEITEPEIRPLDFVGLNAWMTGDEGLAKELMKMNWKTYRGDLMLLSEAELNRQVKAIRSWGASTFSLITPSQVKIHPEGGCVEVMDCDRMADGKPPYPEPNLRHVNPLAYAQTVNSILPIARDRGITVCAGASNMDNYPWWKAFSAALDPSVILTPHRYPRDGRKVTNPQIGAVDREDEINKWFAAVGNKEYIVSEFGFNLSRSTKWSGDFWDWLAKIPIIKLLVTYQLTEKQQAEFTKWDFDYWKRHGAISAFLYQLNSGPPGSGEQYGIRRYSTNPFDWRPVALIFL